MAKKKPKVFIIDDDKFLLDMYSIKFKEQGFDVEVSDTGEDALKVLRDGLIVDVLLFDIVMPGANGFEVLKTIRKERLGGSPKLLILSNQSQQADKDKAEALGVDGYIVKASAVPSEIVKSVVDLVEKSRK